jgi:hypothetical protein
LTEYFFGKSLKEKSGTLGVAAAAYAAVDEDQVLFPLYFFFQFKKYLFVTLSLFEFSSRT